MKKTFGETCAGEKKGGKCYYGKDGEIERAEEGSRGLEGCRERRRRKKRKGMVV